MKYIIRTDSDHLALANTETNSLIVFDGNYVALPDARFWAILKSKGIYDEMVKENPQRMARVEKNGVGELRQEKEILTRSGLTRLSACSQIPTIGTVERISEMPRIVEI